MDFQLALVSPFKSDARYSARLERDLRSLPFQKWKAEKCNVVLWANCFNVLIPRWTRHSLTGTANVTSASVSLQQTLRPRYVVLSGYSSVNLWRCSDVILSFLITIPLPGLHNDRYRVPVWYQHIKTIPFTSPLTFQCQILLHALFW